MKTIYRLVAFLLLLAPAVLAQEHYTEGPVWRVSLVRVKPTAMDAYLTSLRQSSKPILDQEKRDGTIMDYKFFLKETKSNPEDWDVCLAVEFKNHAAMDGFAAKGEMVRDKITWRQTTRPTARRKARRNPRTGQLGTAARDHPQVSLLTTDSMFVLGWILCDPAPKTDDIGNLPDVPVAGAELKGLLCSV